MKSVLQKPAAGLRNTTGLIVSPNYDQKNHSYWSPDPVYLTLDWLEQGRSPYPELYQCNSSAEECGIPIGDEGVNIDLCPYLDAIIVKSVFQDRVKWTYSASEQAFILNKHAKEWGLTRKYSPSTVGKYLKQLFNDPDQVRHPQMELILMDHANIERETRREPKKCRDKGTQRQHFYTYYKPWHPEGSPASSERQVNLEKTEVK